MVGTNHQDEGLATAGARAMKPVGHFNRACGTPQREGTFNSVSCNASRLKIRRAQQQQSGAPRLRRSPAQQCMRSDAVEGGDFYMTFSDLRAYLNARFAIEEGQTMAEYGVVLTVIAVGTVLAFTALKTGIAGAITNVVSNL
jgi:Flp pilus assembly pilin Flp